jgi:hypothetical protein
MADSLYAVERYDAAGAAGAEFPLRPLAGAARLVAAVRLAADDVLLALVTGPDPETVAAAAVTAGWRVDRITPATWIHPPATLEALP